MHHAVAEHPANTLTSEEFTVLAHVRGWAHHAPTCTMCQAIGHLHDLHQEVEAAHALVARLTIERDSAVRTLDSLIGD